MSDQVQTAAYVIGGVVCFPFAAYLTAKLVSYGWWRGKQIFDKEQELDNGKRERKA